jgi:ubiquinone/menaquinone biosynthesis C-methylase UbiE
MDEEQYKRSYYEHKATTFDETCIHENDEHNEALRIIASLLPALGATSVLDVGCGTGRGIGYFLKRFPEMRCAGLDASGAQLLQAQRKRGVAAELLHEGDATRLPFADGSFDVVCQFGALHHIRKPNDAVREMTRVARRAVFLSDCNRYGQGSPFARRLKWWLGNAGLWQTAYRVHTRGKGYYITEEDGLGYSYSVHDSLEVLDAWADRVMVWPTSSSDRVQGYPWLTHRQLLVGAVKGPLLAEESV